MTLETIVLFIFLEGGDLCGRTGFKRQYNRRK